MFTGLPGGSPGPHARTTSRGFWFAVIFGLAILVLFCSLFRYVVRFIEEAEKNPQPMEIKSKGFRPTKDLIDLPERPKDESVER